MDGCLYFVLMCSLCSFACMCVCVCVCVCMCMYMRGCSQACVCALHAPNVHLSMYVHEVSYMSLCMNVYSIPCHCVFFNECVVLFCYIIICITVPVIGLGLLKKFHPCYYILNLLCRQAISEC